MITVVDFLMQSNGVISPRNKEILEERFKGCSLLEIGKKYNMSKEGIHRIINKELSKHTFYEDQYYELFIKYDISEDVFCAVTGLGSLSYGYLMSLRKGKPKAQNNIFDLWFDMQYDKKFRNDFFCKLKEAKGIEVPIAKKERDSIFRIVLMERYKQQRSMLEFMEDYNAFLKEYHCCELRPMSEKSFINKLENNPHALLSRGRVVRYYDFAKHDFAPLLEKFRFREKHGEVSTVELFLDFRVTLERCDIHDPFELHNLLRKISRIPRYKKRLSMVSFCRTPLLRVDSHC